MGEREVRPALWHFFSNIFNAVMQDPDCFHGRDYASNIFKLKWLIVIAVIGVAIYVFSSTDDEKDRRVWIEFRSYLVESQIEQILVNKQVLTAPEKDQVLKWLQEAEYDKSNRIGHGPTPEIVITLKFKDGETEHFGYWGADTFETSPRFLDPKTQFLIKSQDLGSFVSQPKYKRW